MAGKEKLLGIQYLRAIAALMVAYYHLRSQIPAFTADLSFDCGVDSKRLSLGVAMFFVISGFIMYVTGRRLSTGEFVQRRLVRILPLYWCMTLAVSGIAILAPSLVHRTDVTPEFLAKSLLFIPYHNPTQRGILFPILVPGWTLNYEMTFYAIFAAALIAPIDWRMRTVGVSIGTLVVAGILRSRPGMIDIWGFYTSSQLLLFAAGIGLGAVYTRLGTRNPLPKLTRTASALAVVAGFWMLLGNDLPGDIGAVAVVAGVVTWEHQFGLPRWRPLLLLGDASYSIYLAHLFAFGLVRALWTYVPLRGEIGAPFFAFTSMVAAIGLALITYSSIERPALAFFAKIRRRNLDGPSALQAQ